MFCLYFILSLCVVTYCKQDGEWYNCKPKPGCSIAHCDSNDGIYNENPILCQQNKSTSSVDTEINHLKKRIAEMEKNAEENRGKTENVIKRIDLLMKKNAEMKVKIKLRCPIKHENKCFFPVIKNEVNYDGGVAMCERFGAHLANIYSQTHMDDVMTYIRKNGMDGFSYANPRLGMKYDPKAKKLTLRDGTDAPAGLKWANGRPFTAERWSGFAEYTNVILAVNIDQSSIYQYLINALPSTTSFVLCEIE